MHLEAVVHRLMSSSGAQAHVKQGLTSNRLWFTGSYQALVHRDELDMLLDISQKSATKPLIKALIKAPLRLH